MPLDPAPVAPVKPALRDCDDGVTARPLDQASLDALSGCTSLYGLQLRGTFDLRPLASLRRVGSGGLTIGGDTGLAGLENLEEAASLMLLDMRQPDLAVFESLRDVEWLTLTSVQVPSLRGLEAVESIRNLDISSNALLESLDGLVPPSEMNSVALRDNPALSDISALRYVTRISSSLALEGTALEALPFEALSGAISEVSIGDSPRLADISGLRNLESIEGLFIYGTALRSAPRFERLTHLRAFGLEANLVLEATPSFPLVTSVVSFVVRSNPVLTTLLGFSAVEFAEYISVSQNHQLTEIDLGSLRQTYQLHIFDNLEIDGAAVAAALADVESTQSRIPLVQTPPPITPCPWTQDAICDSSFCVPAEDPACSRETP